MLMLYHAGRYFMPRKRLTGILLLALIPAMILVFVILPVQVRFFMSTIAGAITSKHSTEELESMIPLDTQGKALIQQRNEPGNLNDSLKDDILFTDDVSLKLMCKPRDPNVMFFVRIPKCASTAFVEFLKVLGKHDQFEFFFHPSGAFDWDGARKKKVADFVKSKKKVRRFVYARHFYYVDFHQFGLLQYTFVAIVREPVSRFKSSFLYYHYSSKQHINALLDRKHRGETLKSCIEHQHEGCAYNWMTKYFCGHERFCKLGGEEALEFAKENLRKEFAVVLILEEMDLSFKVLKSILPNYFSQVDPSRFKLPKINENMVTRNVTAEEIQAIQKVNTADIELYNYAKELLHKKARACGLLS